MVEAEAPILGELEDRGRTVAAQALEDHGAALGRDVSTRFDWIPVVCVYQIV